MMYAHSHHIIFYVLTFENVVNGKSQAFFAMFLFFLFLHYVLNELQSLKVFGIKASSAFCTFGCFKTSFLKPNVNVSYFKAQQ